MQAARKAQSENSEGRLGPSAEGGAVIVRGWWAAVFEKVIA